MDKNSLCERHNISRESFDSTGLRWDLLEKIHAHHVAAAQELQTTAHYITDRLQGLPVVHSIKIRIKDPEHLIAKIVRKKIDEPELTFEVDSYQERITDLIGIRALHLFKGDWEQIHEFVKATWELAETPVASVRRGDPEDYQTAFKAAGCDVREHRFGYRSIHYLIQSRPARELRIAELQVRTIFEEGWSEIDHRVRYPRHSDNPYLAGLLTVFNRFAGGADEMGTFTKQLSAFIQEQERNEAERQTALNEKEDQLKLAVSQLEISEADRTELKRQIGELRQSSIGSAAPAFDYSALAQAELTAASLGFAGSAAVAYVPNRSLPWSVCQRCGEKFVEFIPNVTGPTCDSCASSIVAPAGPFTFPGG